MTMVFSMSLIVTVFGLGKSSAFLPSSFTSRCTAYGHLMPQARREASAKLAKSLFEETLSEKPSRTVLDRKAVEDVPQVIN